jgi:hypothetical protein
VKWQHWFWSLVAAYIVPLWGLTSIPSHDGGLHAYGVHVLERLLAGDELFRKYFELHYALTPYWCGHMILLGLSRLVGPDHGEKLYLSLYLLSLAVAAWWALRRMQAASPFACLLVIPFLYNATFLFGFYNFIISLPLYFVVVAYWWEHHERLERKALVMLAAMLTVGYGLHPLTAIMTAGSISFLALCLAST